jgi:hypothetical protein
MQTGMPSGMRFGERTIANSGFQPLQFWKRGLPCWPTSWYRSVL